MLVFSPTSHLADVGVFQPHLLKYKVLFFYITVCTHHCIHVDMLLLIFSACFVCTLVHYSLLCALSFLFVLIQKETKRSRQTQTLCMFCLACAHPKMCSEVCKGSVDRMYVLCLRTSCEECATKQPHIKNSLAFDYSVLCA